MSQIILTGFGLGRDGLRRLARFAQSCTVLGFDTELVLLALLQSAGYTYTTRRRSYWQTPVNKVNYLFICECCSRKRTGVRDLTGIPLILLTDLVSRWHR